MRILFVGPPLYGLLYPVLSLAQAFRVNGHEVLIASGGKFAQKAAEAGLVVFDAAPGFDSEAGYRRQEALRKENNIGTKMGNFSFFSEEMTDPLVAFAGQWRPDLIVYPPLGVVGPLIAAKYDIPVVMQTVGFGHTPWHIKGVTKSLSNAYRRHGVSAPPRDLAWIDVTPPSMSILQNDGEPVISMQYVPYNGGAVWEEWWERTPDRKRLLVSLGTVKPMVDGLDLISWVMDSAGEVDAEIILHLPANARSDLRSLPPNVRLVDWLPMGVFLNGADGFIHHGGAGNTRLAERGSNLSGGQRQRIALARALITAPELLILDDTTSAVDAGTEAEINTALGRYADNEHMLLVIARRRSTLQLADRIVVLDKGRVVDIGTQAELDARCPTFRSLMSGEGDFLALAPAEQRTLWPTTQAVKSDDAHERQTPAGKGFVDRMTRVPERAVQMALAGHGRQVSSLLTPVAWMFVIAALLIALDSAAGVGVLVLLQRGIDSGVAAGDMSTIGICALLALCLVAIGWCCYALQTIFAARAAESVQHTVRLRSFSHLLRLSLPWHEKHIDSRLTRMTVDVDSLARFLQNGLASAATSIVTMVAIAAAMFWLDPILALTALSAVPVVMLATWIYRRLSSPAYAQARLEIGKVNSTLQEKVSGMRVVQSHGQQQQEAARLRALSDNFRATRVRAQKYLAVYFPFLTFCTEAAYAAVLLIGASRVAGGEMTPGILAAFFLLLGQFYGPVQQLSGIVDSWQQATASGKHINALLATEETENIEPSSITPGTGALRLEALTFLYPEKTQPVLDNLSLIIPPGTVVAVVGRSGAGKSTLIKLLAGLYSPGSGQIRVGERLIDAASLSDYRRQTGLVTQDVALFSGDIAENIRYPRPDSSDTEVESAARRAGLFETVQHLPLGFRTPVNNGGTDLSAGQRQLIALARAHLAQAHILLLDEATARIDRSAEERLMTSLTRVTHTEKRIALIVAHRLTTARRCDVIVVIDKGCIAEYGSHEQLIAAHGLYARLWRNSIGQTRDTQGEVIG